MNLPEEIIKNQEKELLVTAQLAVAFTHLAMAPFDSWSHEGGPAEMAVHVVMDAKKNGNLSHLEESMMLDPRYYGRR
jgi:hypothetical protein